MKANRISHHRQKRLQGFAAVLLGLFLALMIATPSLAAPGVSWEVSPLNPYVGDTLVITGESSPSAEFRSDVSFEETVAVSGGEYYYQRDKVKIPEGDNNRFAVRAEPVQSLNVGVSASILPWLTRTGTVNEGIGTYSHADVPALTYKVKIFGNAADGASSVNIRIKASQTIKADSNGNFRYNYDTDTMPAGDYLIEIGGTSKVITLREKPSSSGGSGTGSASVRPSGEEEEEIPEVTENETEIGPLDEENEDEESGEGEEEGTGSAGEGSTGDQPPVEGVELEAENETEEPLEEPPLGGSFAFFGIIGSLLIISLARKSRK